MQNEHYLLCYGKDAVNECQSYITREPGTTAFMVGKKESGKSTLAQVEADEVLSTTPHKVIFINPDDDLDYSYFTSQYPSDRFQVLNYSIASSINQILKDTLMEQDVIRWIYIDSADMLTLEDQQKLYYLCQVAEQKNFIITILLSSMKRFAQSGTYPNVMWGYIRHYILTELDDIDFAERNKLFYLNQNQVLYQYASNAKIWNTFDNSGKCGKITDHRTYVERFEKKKHDLKIHSK